MNPLLFLALIPTLNQLFKFVIGSYAIGFIVRIFTDFGIPIWYFKKKNIAVLDSIRKVPLKSVLFWCGGTIVVLTTVLLSVLPFISAEQIRSQLNLLYPVTPAIYLLVALTIGIINPVFEEYFWRSFLYGQTKKMWTGWLFGIHHMVLVATWIDWPLVLLTGFLMGCVGVFFNWLYAKHDSVVLPFTVHVVADIVIVVYGYFLLF